MTNVSRDVYVTTVSPEDKDQVITITLPVVLGTICILAVVILLVLLVLVILYFKCRAAHGVCNKCQYEKSMKSTERVILYSCRIVKDCKTDRAILKYMHTMLSDFMREKKFSGKFVNLVLEPMRKQLEENIKGKTTKMITVSIILYSWKFAWEINFVFVKYTQNFQLYSIMMYVHLFIQMRKMFVIIVVLNVSKVCI